MPTIHARAEIARRWLGVDRNGNVDMDAEMDRAHDDGHVALLDLLDAVLTVGGRHHA